MDLANAIREAGGVVAGGSAVGGAVAWIAAVLLSDLGARIDVTRWVQYGAGFGGTFGIAVLLLRLLGVR